MEPIVLTPSNDTFTPPEKTNEEDKFPSCGSKCTWIGTHSCGGGMHTKTISLTHQIISCTGCGRTLEPLIEVDGYEKLREWCKIKIVSLEVEEREFRDLKLKVAIMFGAPDRNYGKRWEQLDKMRALDSQS